MLSFRKPTTESLRQFVAVQSQLPFSYSAIGATLAQPPDGYVVDRTRVPLGMGEQAYVAAKSALDRWRQFHLGWLEVWPPDAVIRRGESVAVVARVMHLWWVNACRIVYVVDETGPITRHGFAYGTLPGHAETGEERFWIEWNRADNVVAFEILAFSRPFHILARIGNPLARRIQCRFAREACAAMIHSVAETTV